MQVNQMGRILNQTKTVKTQNQDICNFMRNTLYAVRDHQRLISNNLSNMSTTYTMLNQAINTIEQYEKEHETGDELNGISK